MSRALETPKTEQSDERTVKACQEIAETLSKKLNPSKNDFLKIKRRISAKHKLSRIPANSTILTSLPPERRGELRRLLMIKPVRTASGISVIAIMTKPHPCPPQAQCVYCPGGVKTGSPKSYTGYEPAALRGVQNDFDGYREVEARLRQLEAAGHQVQKSEFIIMGGTFLNFPAEYQEEFVKGCFDALNGTAASSLEEAHRISESAPRRNVGVTFETRPDLCREPEVDMMLRLGATRVEIGAQIPADEIYRLVKRGHTVQDVVDSFRISKDAGLKVVAHMMPGLPGSSPEKDLEAFKRLFENPDFKPDMLKIYPTLVVSSAELHRWWSKGDYKPYSLETTVNLLADVKQQLPDWVRIMRIQRDIPARLIEDGVKKSNLRELVHEELNRRGAKCKCIRCREIGLKRPSISYPDEDNVELKMERYEASGGEETFLSLVDKQADALVGFVRVRSPSGGAHRPEVKEAKGCGVP
ncbi:MAG: tRNA uridine(34) 5-carboxymethylaminomethyl modification radical SAM/GNAT enzyme Elp3, partial [Thaumarchaeota archaeon]|nr:tRNA uridine(34) 5-carboxymethylaminomethyl modification radical SAM/GNAT enzyme Elp3 [Nitrososphaerota archaeon]